VRLPVRCLFSHKHKAHHTPITNHTATTTTINQLHYNTTPVNVYLPKDRVTNAHQGYGFVEFRGEEDADYVRSDEGGREGGRGRQAAGIDGGAACWGSSPLEQRVAQLAAAAGSTQKNTPNQPSHPPTCLPLPSYKQPKPKQQTQCIKILNMVKMHGKPLRVSKSSQDRNVDEVGANLFVGNLDPDVDEKVRGGDGGW
jgi:RNA recognition motif-containing protein